MVSICEQMDDAYGLRHQPKRKGECPKCHGKHFWVNAADTFGKCWSPNCGWTVSAWQLSENAGVYAILGSIERDWHGALLKGHAEDYTAARKAYDYVCKERGISERVLADAKIGVVPGAYVVADQFKEWLDTLREEVSNEKPKRGRKKKDEWSPAERLEWAERMQDSLVARCHDCPGWLAFFYTDDLHRITQIRFRNIDAKRFRSFKVGSSSGLFGREMFSTSGSPEYDKFMIVTEGEFNTLQLQSLSLKQTDSYVNAASVGSANGADYETIASVCEQPVFIYDNDDNQAGDKLYQNAQQYMDCSYVTTPAVDSDLDQYIRSFKSNATAAWNAIVALIASRVPQDKAWETKLLLNKQGHPVECYNNVLLILENHATWKDRIWFDAVRLRPMLDNTAITDPCILDIASAIGTEFQIPVRSYSMIERSVLKTCRNHDKDLIREWLDDLPKWDGTERLLYWLSDIADVDKNAYSMEISRLIPVSMVARGYNPGCQYRSVVIFEGPENSGKTKLVIELAGPEWYVELTKGLDTKEALMMLQGTWVAEFAELDSLSKTEETQLKAFITHQEDVWVPKYSNLKTASKRRTIFIGTTNDESYLKGQSGNTRYLPINLPAKEIRIDLLESMKDQLFAEAMVYYQKSQDTWWRLSDEAEALACAEREERRQHSIYEDGLSGWLGSSTETSWDEIAKGFLKLQTPAEWKDKSLQMQIGLAMRALGWKRKQRGDNRARIWKKKGK